MKLLKLMKLLIFYCLTTCTPHLQTDNNVSTMRAESGNALKFKLKNFMIEDPRLWFTLVDHWFDQFGITEDAEKVQHVIRYLPDKIILQLSDIINSQSPCKYMTTRLSKWILLCYRRKKNGRTALW